jgi:hypothetical protein
VRGWVTEERGDGILVTFIGGNDNHAPQALYRVSISANGEVSVPPHELKDPVPTEIHVFWNLWTGIPLYIATPPNGTIWNLSKGKISLVKRGAAK